MLRHGGCAAFGLHRAAGAGGSGLRQPPALLRRGRSWRWPQGDPTVAAGCFQTTAWLGRRSRGRCTGRLRQGCRWAGPAMPDLFLSPWKSAPQLLPVDSKRRTFNRRHALPSRRVGKVQGSGDGYGRRQHGPVANRLAVPPWARRISSCPQPISSATSMRAASSPTSVFPTRRPRPRSSPRPRSCERPPRSSHGPWRVISCRLPERSSSKESFPETASPRCLRFHSRMLPLSDLPRSAGTM